MQKIMFCFWESSVCLEIQVMSVYDLDDPMVSKLHKIQNFPNNPQRSADNRVNFDSMLQFSFSLSLLTKMQLSFSHILVIWLFLF